MDHEFLNNSNKLDRSSSLTDLSKLNDIVSPSKYNVFESASIKNLQSTYGNKPLVRHFSCEQIYDPRLGSSPVIRIKDTVSVGFQHQEFSWSNWDKHNSFGRCILPERQMKDLDNAASDTPADIKYFGNLRNFDFSFVKDCVEKLDVTPMEVDKSMEEPKDSSEKAESEADSKIRKRRRVKKEDDVQENRRKILKGSESDDKHIGGISKKRLFFMFVFLPILSYITLLHDKDLTVNENFIILTRKVFGQREHCNDILNINPILNDLKNNLHGQDSVINNLSNYLHVNNFKILLFTGPTGVGKSYTVERIKRNFIWSKNIQDVTYPLSESEMKISKLSLSPCGYNLIVLDGLTNTSSENIYEFVRSIQQFSYEKKMKTIMILVYSTQEIADNLKVLPVDASKDILKGFEFEFKDGLDINLVVFNRLNMENVISCVLSEAADLGYEVTREEAEEIAKDIPQIYGCKGARAKLNLMQCD